MAYIISKFVKEKFVLQTNFWDELKVKLVRGGDFFSRYAP